MTCPDCEAALREGARKCPHCGWAKAGKASLEPAENRACFCGARGVATIGHGWKCSAHFLTDGRPPGPPATAATYRTMLERRHAAGEKLSPGELNTLLGKRYDAPLRSLALPGRTMTPEPDWVTEEV